MESAGAAEHAGAGAAVVDREHLHCEVPCNCSRILSTAAFTQGLSAQAIPSFGSERMGAPVMAFCRIDDKEIRLREPVLTPDALIIQDQTLLYQAELFAGLGRDGYMLVNSTMDFGGLGLDDLLDLLALGRPGLARRVRRVSGTLRDRHRHLHRRERPEQLAATLARCSSCRRRRSSSPSGCSWGR